MRNFKYSFIYCLHDDFTYLDIAFRSVRSEVGILCFAFISCVPWHGNIGGWQRAEQTARDLGMTVVVGDWTSELAQRQAACDHLLSLGYTHALIPDGDEIIEPSLLSALLTIARNELAERVYVHWDTYWKSPHYVIRPRERFTPCYLLDLRVAKPTGGRNFTGGRPLVLGPDYGLVHHLSWVGPESRIQRKLETWGHAKEVLPGWHRRIWQAWEGDKLLRHLHPTHPDAYGFAEKVNVPDLLLPALARYGELTGDPAPEPLVPAVDPWPQVSVVIPVHGGRDDLFLCLESLAPLHAERLLREVVVVDNASPDRAWEVAEAAGYAPFVRVLRNEENRGFARACNQGADAVAGNFLLFLNSDTVLPRAGLLRLVEGLARSGSIGAAGPCTNRAGHGQQVEPTYTSLDTLPLFADDFARREREDTDTDMLVGFCLLVRRSVWDEVRDKQTGQGFDERFGLGTWEDNDLCYRIRRAGYRLVRAAQSFVHHAGSKTLARIEPDIRGFLARNERLFRHKWQADLESGYASTLSGLSADRLVFDPARHPDVRLKQMRAKARQADISLVMIVKNEQRVLGEALASAAPFFREMVVVDTGSTDNTVALAQAAGAQVFSFPWTNSFSEARNHSLAQASGAWCFWMDADDTLTWESGEAIVHAALTAPPQVVGFIVPVQFVEDNQEGNKVAGGTRMDHVKLFRRLPGLAFEGRIHEQILPSLRRVAGPQSDLARCGAVVLHSGYDTSPEGQARKRERNATLLALDLAERPDHPFVLFNLGMTDHYGGRHPEAVDWLRQSIAAARAGESHVRKAYALLAVSLRETGDTDAALQAVEEGLAAVGGDDPELHFHAGFLLTAQGRYAEAQAHYAQVLACAAGMAGHFSSVDMGILGYKTFHNLGQVCYLQNDYAGAKGWWEKAITAAPQFLPSAFDLFHAAVEREDAAVAQAMIETVAREIGVDQERIVEMQVQFAEGRGQVKAQGDALLHQMLRAHPDRPHPRLLLARRLLAAGREADAAPHLHHLSEQGIAEGAFFLGVSAVRRDDFAQALSHMERALALNPGHPPTVEQVANLRRVLSENAPPETGTNDRGGPLPSPA